MGFTTVLLQSSSWGSQALSVLPQKSPDVLVDDLLSLAFQKTTLVSYKTLLYITNHHLADEMVSDVSGTSHI